MNFSRRHFFGAATGLATAAVLSACGSNSGGVATGSSSAPSAGASGTGKLLQWYHEYGEKGTKEAVERYAKAFKGADVTVKWNLGTDYMTLLATTLLSGNGVPDVFESENGATLDMIQKGQVADLTDTVGADTSKFSKPVLDRMTYQGKIWAVPQVVDMQMLYYRKSVLAKAKVDPPKTFAGLVAAAKAVKTDTMGGFFAGNDGGLGVLADLLIWSAGFEQLNSDETGLGFMESNFFDAVNAYRDFYNSGALLTSASKDWFDGSPFINGETAMQWTGLWALNDIKKKWGDDFGVLPFPSIGSTGRQAVPFGAYGSCAATKGTNHNIPVAEEYIKWLWIDQTDKQIDFANSFGTHIPAQPALVSQASQISSGAGKEAAGFVDKLGHASGLLWTSTISDSFNAALTNVVKKKANAQSEFAGVQKTAQGELKRIKK